MREGGERELNEEGERRRETERQRETMERQRGREKQRQSHGERQRVTDNAWHIFPRNQASYVSIRHSHTWRWASGAQLRDKPWGRQRQRRVGPGHPAGPRPTPAGGEDPEEWGGKSRGRLEGVAVGPGIQQRVGLQQRYHNLRQSRF